MPFEVSKRRGACLSGTAGSACLILQRRVVGKADIDQTGNVRSTRMRSPEDDASA